MPKLSDSDEEPVVSRNRRLSSEDDVRMSSAGDRGPKRGGDGGRALSRRTQKEEETRRILRWIAFAKPKVIFGFDHLSPAFVPTMAGKSRGLSISFEKVYGWRPPQQILKDIDFGGFEVSVQLSLSFFHLNSASFFGSTWMGSPLPLGGDGKDSIPDVIDFDYGEIVYLISRLTDPSCIGVVEIVASKFDTRKNVVVAQYGYERRKRICFPFLCGLAAKHCKVSV